MQKNMSASCSSSCSRRWWILSNESGSPAPAIPVPIRGNYRHLAIYSFTINQVVNDAGGTPTRLQYSRYSSYLLLLELNSMSQFCSRSPCDHKPV